MGGLNGLSLQVECDDECFVKADLTTYPQQMILWRYEKLSLNLFIWCCFQELVNHIISKTWNWMIFNATCLQYLKTTCL